LINHRAATVINCQPLSTSAQFVNMASGSAREQAEQALDDAVKALNKLRVFGKDKKARRWAR
jgi:hypothetical protein